MNNHLTMELFTETVGENPEPSRALPINVWWIPAHLPTTEESISQRFSEPGNLVKVEYTSHDGVRNIIPIESRDPEEVSRLNKLSSDRQKLTSSGYLI